MPNAHVAIIGIGATRMLFASHTQKARQLLFLHTVLILLRRSRVHIYAKQGHESTQSMVHHQ